MMVKTPMRIVATLALMVLTLTLVTGCEDGEARQRASIQKSLTDAGKELRQVTAAGFVPGSDEFNKSRAGLDRVIKTLNAINPEDDGQKAAKALMTASALREAAIMDYAHASALEARQRDSREVLHTKIDAITTLAAVADGQQMIDASPDARSLDKERQAAMQRIEELSKRIEQLAGPIGERTSANDTAKQEVERLKTEVNNLRRQAAELGNADGFVTYQRAIETRRKADKIEYDISQREMELGYSLQPDHDLADEESKHLQTRIGALQITHKELDAFSKATADSIAATRNQMAELAGEVAAELNKVADTAATELAPLYEQVETALQKAASMAGAGGAGSAEDMSAARMLKARILELEGKFSAMKAASLADHKALLQKLNDAGKAIPSSDDVKKELEAAGAALTAAVEKAKASFTEAMDALSQVKSREEAVELFRKNLENAVAILAGQKLAEPPKTGSLAPASGATVAASTSGSPGNFATAEQLAKYLASLPGDLQGANMAMAVYRAQTPDGRNLLQANRRALDSFIDLDKALQETLGTTLLQVGGPVMAAGISGARVDLTGLTPTEQSDDQVVYSVSIQGQTWPITLRKVDNSWWIDIDAQASQMARTLPMMLQSSGQIAEAVTSAAAKVRAGEITDPQQVLVMIAQAVGTGAAPAGGTENP